MNGSPRILWTVSADTHNRVVWMKTQMFVLFTHRWIMCRIALGAYKGPTAFRIAHKHIKLNCGWTICCTNGEPVIVIVRVPCHTSKRTAVGPRTSCFGLCWRQRICRKVLGANWAEPKPIHYCTSAITKRACYSYRNSSPTQITSRWTKQIKPHQSFRHCMTYRWHHMRPMMSRFPHDANRWCKRRRWRHSKLKPMNKRIYEIFAEH